MHLSSIFLMALIIANVSGTIYLVLQMSAQVKMRTLAHRPLPSAMTCLTFGTMLLMYAASSLAAMVVQSVWIPDSSIAWFTPTFLVTGYGSVALMITAFVLAAKAPESMSTFSQHRNSAPTPPERS